MTPNRRLLITLAGVAVIAAAFALRPGAVAAQAVFAEDGLAIRGTDTVAYFTESRAVPGDPAFATDWGGARWLFASDANKALFVADPEAYAPQFGGYCSWAVAEGYTAPVDPEAWKIVDGKLYLNYSKSVQRTWEGDVPGNIARAEVNWPKLKE